MNDEIITRTHLTCPVCGAREELDIPADMCLFFHTCSACGTRLAPRTGRLLRVLLIRRFLIHSPTARDHRVEIRGA